MSERKKLKRDQYPVTRWAAMWRDDEREFFMWNGLCPHLFNTRKAARDWIIKTHGYIKTRKDSRSAPFNWRLPIPVKVWVILKEAK